MGSFWVHSCSLWSIPVHLLVQLGPLRLTQVHFMFNPDHLSILILITCVHSGSLRFTFISLIITWVHFVSLLVSSGSLWIIWVPLGQLAVTQVYLGYIMFTWILFVFTRVHLCSVWFTQVDFSSPVVYLGLFRFILVHSGLMECT